jgi:hypothetical protein
MSNPYDGSNPFFTIDPWPLLKTASDQAIDQMIEEQLQKNANQNADQSADQSTVEDDESND